MEELKTVFQFWLFRTMSTEEWLARSSRYRGFSTTRFRFTQNGNFGNNGNDYDNDNDDNDDNNDTIDNHGNDEKYDSEHFDSDDHFDDDYNNENKITILIIFKILKMMSEAKR